LAGLVAARAGGLPNGSDLWLAGEESEVVARTLDRVLPRDLLKKETRTSLIKFLLIFIHSHVYGWIMVHNALNCQQTDSFIIRYSTDNTTNFHPNVVTIG
jgi:hypothetical protein